MTSLKDKYPKEKCYQLRVPLELYERMVAAAQEDHRSLNNWIVRTLWIVLTVQNNLRPHTPPESAPPPPP